ncbi:MAG TPA: hypothetical protein VNF46_03040 [Gammaproteobacteria bacterium]|nr:hypothetical protein [Gammaproteobacteria bacterium]
MSAVTYANLLILLGSGQLEIGEVGAFWSQATRLRMPEIAAPVLSISMTLHMSGEMDHIVYAQLLAGPGLKQARRRADLNIAWSRHRPVRGREMLAINSFAIPGLGLYWQGEAHEKEARQLGAEFASVLAEEFPDPVAELLRYFSTDLDTLVSQLGEADYLQAGATLPSNSEKH